MPSPPSEFARPEPRGDITPALTALLDGRTLTADQMQSAFELIMSGAAHHGEIGALLALLATRPPTGEELLGAARVMRAHVDAVATTIDPDRIVDTAGTGGAPKTFNVSTAAAIVAAAAGEGSFAVAKHGNRSRTGRGSAEVLKQLGVEIDADRDVQARCLETTHLCFCFAIHHHPAALHAMPVRKALGFPTIFNLLGPLTNPAGAKRQLMGVYHADFVDPVARALADLGATRAMVIHSDDGLDELSISAPTTVVHVEGGGLRRERIDPAALGLATGDQASVVAGSLDEAVAWIHGILDGTIRGPRRDMTLLNTAATLVVSGHADSIETGLPQAARAIASGAATATLEMLVRASAS